VFGEFRSVVSENEFYRKRKYFKVELKEFRGGRKRDMGFSAPSESESGIGAFERNDEPAVAAQMFLNGVESHQTLRIENFKN